MTRMVVGWQLERIIGDIEAFCARVRLSDREFSEMAASMNFMSRLRRGQASMQSLRAAAEFITAHSSATPQEMRALVEERRAQRKVAA